MDSADIGGTQAYVNKELDCHEDTTLCGPQGMLNPKVGMSFDDLKSAYIYYNEYARSIGFSIKKKRTNKHRRDPNVVVLQTLCCSCEGSYTKVNTPKKRREDRRFGCMSKFEIKLNEDGKYELSKFEAEHTHELVPPTCAYMLRSQRHIQDSQAGVMRKMHSSGLKSSDIFYYFCSEARRAEHLNFIQSDCTNLLGRERKEFLKKGDALCLVDYFKQKRQENKHFFYSFFANEESEHCVYGGETIEEFEESWEELLEDYGLQDNEWLQGLYVLREKWAQVYARAYFCAGITTTQKSESIYKFLKNYFTSTALLRVFVDQYDKAMASRRQKEREAENKMRQTTPILWSDWVVEKEASKIYTKKVFYLFQEEYRKNLDYCLNLESELGTIQMYNIARLGKVRRGRTVSYCRSDQSVHCSCRKFEFEGILCSDILKLFHDLDFQKLPPQYYLKRWTRGVTNEVVYDSYGYSIPSDVDPGTTDRYSQLSHVYQRLLAKGSKSDHLFSLSLSKMLAFEVELDMEIANDEEQSGISLQKRKVSPSKRTTHTVDEDMQLRISVIKRAREEPKGRAKDPLENRKRETTLKQKDDGEGQRGVAAHAEVQHMLHTMGVLSSINQLIQIPQNQPILDSQRFSSTGYHPTQIYVQNTMPLSRNNNAYGMPPPYAPCPSNYSTNFGTSARRLDFSHP